MMNRLLIGLAVILMTAPAFAGAVDVDKLYAAKCHICHSLNGKGGVGADLGGPLDGVGAKRSEEWLRAYMADPKSQMPGAKMPVVQLEKAEFDAMINYMLSLK